MNDQLTIDLQFKLNGSHKYGACLLACQLCSSLRDSDKRKMVNVLDKNSFPARALDASWASAATAAAAATADLHVMSFLCVKQKFATCGVIGGVARGDSSCA